jgi:hypothetical protein
MLFPGERGKRSKSGRPGRGNVLRGFRHLAVGLDIASNRRGPRLFSRQQCERSADDRASALSRSGTQAFHASEQAPV